MEHILKEADRHGTFLVLLSGGVDSSTLLWLSSKQGLEPTALFWTTAKRPLRPRVRL